MTVPELIKEITELSRKHNEIQQYLEQNKKMILKELDSKDYVTVQEYGRPISRINIKCAETLNVLLHTGLFNKRNERFKVTY